VKENHTKSVVTIGTFDGVHLGHQKIIRKLTKTAKEKQLKSIVLTFFPHPRMVLQKNANIQLLNTIEERKKLLYGFGIDDIHIQKFTKEFSELSAESFVKTLLVDKLNAKHIIIGYDHQFGKNRSAGIDDLKIFGKQFGFEVEEISVQDIDDVAVSSTKIRNALNQGDITTANSYLGYQYFLTGIIIKGKGLGRQIDFPTANISIDETYKLIPKQGVYVVKTNIESKTVFGMMNIGINPTVNGKEQSIEVHLFDFNSDIYGKKLKVELLHRLRKEHHFESVDDLKNQLHLDKQDALNLIAAAND
jgi:riboflavin kinase / FMN adenylyltransferase